MTHTIKTSLKILISWRFLLNLAIILVVTCWIPLVSQTMVVRDDDGTIVQERTDTARLYQSWWDAITLKPNLDTHLKAVLWHFGICFVMSYAVWFITLRPWAQPTATGTVQDAKEEEELEEEKPRADE